MGFRWRGKLGGPTDIRRGGRAGRRGVQGVVVMAGQSPSHLRWSLDSYLRGPNQMIWLSKANTSRSRAVWHANWSLGPQKNQIDRIPWKSSAFPVALVRCPAPAHPPSPRWYQLPGHILHPRPRGQSEADLGINRNWAQNKTIKTRQTVQCI